VGLIRLRIQPYFINRGVLGRASRGNGRPYPTRGFGAQPRAVPGAFAAGWQSCYTSRYGEAQEFWRKPNRAREIGDKRRIAAVPAAGAGVQRTRRLGNCAGFCSEALALGKSREQASDCRGAQCARANYHLEGDLDSAEQSTNRCSAGARGERRRIHKGL
jgi:hypothetical protein